MSYLVDTNVLLRLTDKGDPLRGIVNDAVTALLERGERIYYTQQNRREFWNVATRPVNKNGFGFSVSETVDRLVRIDAIFTRLPDRPESGPEWDRLVTQYGVHGSAVHDAQLVAAMLAHGIPRILTFNGEDFRRYAGEVTPMHPMQCVEQVDD